MAAAPALSTPRLQLRPFAERHLGAHYVGWLNDPQTVRYSDQRFRHHTLDGCRDYVASFPGSPHYLWAIERAGDGTHVGNINAYVDTHHQTADIGALLGREAHGQGFGTEAWIAVCDYLLRVKGLRKVTAGTLAVNAGMLKVMNKIGMARELVRVRQCVWEGREIDVIGGCLFREHWLAQHPTGPF